MSSLPPPGAPPPPPGPPLPGEWGTPARRLCGFAVASLVLGIVGVLACFFVVPSMLAVVFGALGLRQIDRRPDALRGRGLAVAGLVLGIVGLAFFVLVLAFGEVSYEGPGLR